MIYAIWATLILATAGWGVFEHVARRALRREKDALSGRLAALTAQKAAERTRVAHQMQELAQARRELAELPPVPVGAAAARQAELREWLARVHALKQLFAQRPNQRIPEMQWLTDEAWLRVARTASLDSEDGIRQAMAEVRSWAKNSFGQVAGSALRRVADAGPAQPPNAASLAPFFDPPVNLDVLNRYDIQASIDGPRVIGSDGNASGFFLTEKAPIDDVFDSRYSISAAGTIVRSPGPESWSDELRQIMNRAYRAYAQANPNDPDPPVQDVLSYVQPPLDPVTTAKLVKAQQLQWQRR